MSQRSALLVGCGEPAVRAGLETFEQQHLSGFDVERILLPGGCWWLAQAAEAASGRIKRIVASRSGAYESVAALLADPRLQRVVLTGHQDCAWYLKRHPSLGPGDVVRRVGVDLYAARAEAVRLGKGALVVTGVMLTRGAAEVWQARGLF